MKNIKTGENALLQWEDLEAKYGLSRTELIATAMGKHDDEILGKSFAPYVIDTILPFKGNYTLLSFGIADDDYLKSGLWMQVQANFRIRIAEGYDLEMTKVFIDEDRINLCKGGLNNMRVILARILANNR